MSALTGFLIVGAVVTVALAGVLWQLRAARREDARQDRFIREHCWPSVFRVPCAPDNEAGVNLGDADDCALTYSLPAYDPATDPQWAAVRQRLFDAVRDHRTNTPEGD